MVLSPLTAQLRKEAVWPMPEEAARAKLALQALACKAIMLYAVDEVDAITRSRPLEQVADGCKAAGPCTRCPPVAGSSASLACAAVCSPHRRRKRIPVARSCVPSARRVMPPGSIWGDCQRSAGQITPTSSPTSSLQTRTPPLFAGSLTWSRTVPSYGIWRGGRPISGMGSPATMRLTRPFFARRPTRFAARA